MDEFKELNGFVDRKDAWENAWNFSESLFKNTNKRPMKRLEFQNVADMIYLSAMSNTTKDLFQFFKDNPTDSIDLILGDLHKFMVKSWNQMRDNPIGEISVEPMDINDVLMDLPVNKFLKKKGNLRA